MLLDDSYRCLNLGGYDLDIKDLASASASNIWPQPGLGLQQKNQHPRRDGPVCAIKRQLITICGWDVTIILTWTYVARALWEDIEGGHA